MDTSLITIRLIDAERGYGVFAAKPLPEGTRLFEEYPLVAMQHGANRADGADVCERCFRFLGPLESQVRGLLVGRDALDGLDLLPERLPAVAGQQKLPAPCGCPGGCGLRYCSAKCAQANFDEHHRLLCPAVPVAASPASQPAHRWAGPQPALDEALESMAVDDAGGCSDAGAADGGEVTPLAHFEAHAKETNEVFLLAAKSAAHIVTQLGKGIAFEEAMRPYVGPAWWEAVATPDDESDEAGFRRTMHQLLMESFHRLVPVLAPHAPPGCPLLDDVTHYATIVGAFERRACAVQVASPVEEYFLAVDELEDGPEKAAITAITSPLLDALDESYATPGDGIGLFPLQATLNHSCEPNVSLLKQEAEEEADGRVVARTTRDVAEGEELCNSYIDTSLGLRERRRELREYGFECGCERCLREEAEYKMRRSEAEGKAAGKRRLK